MKISNMTCGSACVYYILKDKKIKKDMLWIMELAKYFKKTSLCCYNSNLYNDYKNNNYNKDFEGFIYLKEYLKNNTIDEIKLTKEEIKKEINNSKYMICSVSSKIFNDDDSMTGGHFIIVESEKNGEISIINPEKTKINNDTISIDRLLECMKQVGSWRLLINEEVKK